MIVLNVGTPNIPPAKHIMDELCREAAKEEYYIYSTQSIIRFSMVGNRQHMKGLLTASCREALEQDSAKLSAQALKQ